MSTTAQNIKELQTNVIEVEQGMDSLMMHEKDDMRAAINRKKILIINTILHLHYGIQPTFGIARRRITRVYCAAMSLPEQYYLDYKSPEQPGKPLAAFGVLAPSKSALVQIIYQTPNDALIRKVKND